MSDAISALPSDAATTEHRYATRTIHHAGFDYTFRFYMGFASRVTFTPAGGEPIEVYKQDGVFDCKDTDGPLAESTLTVRGGPLDWDVEVEIEDGPLGPPDYRGPIERIQLGLKRRGTPAQGKPRVKPLRGADQISRIQVQERMKVDGGVYAFQGDDGVLEVENDAKTCPPNCKTAPTG
jgi:hypothetical protein